MLASVSSKHRLPAAVITQQETGMTQATKSVRKGLFPARGGETKLFPRKMGVHLEVAHSILPRPAFFLASDTHIPLDLTNGNFPPIKINAWDSDHRTFLVGAIDSRG